MFVVSDNANLPLRTSEKPMIKCECALFLAFQIHWIFSEERLHIVICEQEPSKVQ